MAMARWLVGLVGLAACDNATVVDPTLRFAELDDASINEIIAASIYGNEEAVRRMTSFNDESGDDPACPTVEVDERVVTMVGGCPTRDGVEIHGVARATNHPGWGGDGTSSSAALYEFEQFTIIRGGARVSYDGSVRVTGDLGGNSYEMSSDLITTRAGNVVRSLVSVDCAERRCEFGDGVELLGIGGVLVSGFSDARAARWNLQGVDTVEIALDNMFGSLCGGWRLAGTERGADFPCTR